MRLPRDLDADRLIKSLGKLGYSPVRQTGSHIRIRTLKNGEHHETIPQHSPLKLGTLNVILRNIAAHHNLTRDELLRLLDI
ncbi:MAG: type II toxin-antitoxin system HicA family toxin [Planctomycetes bacterium]|nr:type II toxin-antitoxin system HicA family toxin [Planctomycetota bacterium]